MGELPLIHWLNDTIACALGFTLNVFLVIAILKTSTDKFRSYSYLVLTGAVFDIIFSTFEWISLHQLLIKNGIMYVMPHGLEFNLFKYFGYHLMIAHCFVGMHGLWILPAHYHYRYVIITKPSAPVTVLLRNLLITSTTALCMGAVAVIGVNQAMARGFDYYLSQIDEEWFDQNGNSHFLYAMDFRDSGTLAFFFVSFGITTVCFGISIYYAYKAWKFIVKSGGERSKRTTRLQEQFTKSLLAQTINAVIFAVMPISVMCLSMQFKLNCKWSGLWVMSVISWLAAANAILTLIIIKTYRKYALKVLGLESFATRWGLSKTENSFTGKPSRTAPISQLSTNHSGSRQATD
ncbi:unnamed protein product [Bursaphelenchus xylophilus]|uniref:(pine wood nematode) hypothetical protein n=1 Tax=Bursaphelenchus xylophilus TaxID=6326 RepID=A0A1I7RP74_BURXY|nr:unnamed protein product [Bursaphelenchus xylophilus]CAG9124635.1 unnamed protein product [Bursaphelenchus xylophilus]